MPVGREEKPEISRYLPENPMVGDFNPQRTFFWSYFVNTEHLASIRPVVVPFLRSILC